MSKKKRLQLNDEKEVRDAYRKAHDYCEGHRDGAPGECQLWTGLSIHEVIPRGRGGATDDPNNLKVLCFELNRLLSQDAKVMQWGYEHGYLMHAGDTPNPHDCGTICPFKEVP